MDTTNTQWARIAPVLPVPPARTDGKGRPWSDPRAVLNGILWVLRTGAPWRDLPDRYPSPATCHRWFQRWTNEGRWPLILRELSRGLDLTESFVDASFVPAKKGGSMWDSPSGEKEAKLWLSQAVLVIHALSHSRARLRQR